MTWFESTVDDGRSVLRRDGLALGLNAALFCDSDCKALRF